MKRLILQDKYPNSFAYTYIPKLIKNLVAKDLIKYKNTALDRYIINTYNISISQLILRLSDVKVYKLGTYLVYSFDNHLKINNTTQLQEVLHFINFGNREMRGLHVIDNAFDYITARIGRIYQFYVFTLGAPNVNKILR